MRATAGVYHISGSNYKSSDEVEPTSRSLPVSAISRGRSPACSNAFRRDRQYRGNILTRLYWKLFCIRTPLLADSDKYWILCTTEALYMPAEINSFGMNV